MEKTDIKQDNYFGTKPEQERMRNVATTIGGIINQKKVEEDTTEEEKPTEPAVNPVVDMVGNAIKNFKPKGHFVQGVSAQNVRKGS